ncbi:hypothetical protein KY345_05855 [Candidatus Woesearchaeota archaeon]|nr:hypothetical protein [Candidatus Woesearchaeota archaeon]
MTEIDGAKLKEAEDILRETINWVAVFETEYDLPKEVVDQLKEKLQKVSEAIGIGVL